MRFKYYNNQCRKTNASLYKCRCGGTGRRTGLKILRLNKPCRFDSGHLHQKVVSMKVDTTFYLLKLIWNRKGGLEKGPVDLFPDAARRFRPSAPLILKSRYKYLLFIMPKIC